MARFEPNTLHNRGDRCADITATAGVGNPGKGHGVGFADYDLDGDLDLYTAVGGHYPGDLWPNGHRNHFLGVDLGPQAIGAQLRLRAQDLLGVVEISSGPGFPALLNAGHIAGQLRRYDDAVAYCRRAVAVRPDDAEGWYLLGLGLFSNGERAAAEQALHRSLALSADAEALRAKTQQLLNTLQQQPTGTP